MNPRPRPLTAVLRQIAPGGIASVEFYPLPVDGSVILGRDPVCQIVLDSRSYKGVSRQHAQISPLLKPEGATWQVCDLNSSNGTYVNGCRIQGEERLHEGDRISLGKRGPQFMFELLDLNVAPEAAGERSLLPPLSSPATAPNEPSGTHSFEDDSADGNSYHSVPSGDVTFSQLFPIISTGRDLTAKAYLIPGMVTVLFVVLMFVAVGNPGIFNTLLAGYLSAGAYFFVYRLCGKHKPPWLLISAGVLTAAVLLINPIANIFIFIFRTVLPGTIPAEPSSVSVFSLFTRMFFGAGLMEELIKALPILGAWAVGRYARSSYYRRVAGVNEPLDGILIGTASAVGFTLIETLHLYIPEVVNGSMFPATGIDSELVGLQLLIPRILGSVFGHMAYSGYLGYFIGLSALKPQRQWQIILIGYFSASILHALWNTTGFVSVFVLAVIGVLSYAFLAAAILKARALSPTRSQNFATQFTHWKDK